MRLLLIPLLALLALPAQAAMDILTTTASLGALTREVGGDEVKVTVMAPSDRDPHDLTASLKGRRGIIVRTPYQPEDGARMLADHLGWPVAVLPIEPAEDARLDGYLALIDRWVDTLAAKR